MIDLDSLGAKAKAATPGAWSACEVWSKLNDQHCDSARTALFWPDTSKGGVHTRRLDPDRDGQFRAGDAEFFAAANPATILELIRELREARAAAAAERDEMNDFFVTALKLALDAECLWLDCTDNVVVSKWMDPLYEAITRTKECAERLDRAAEKGGTR